MPKGQYERKPAVERFWSYVEKTDACWLWKGGCTSKGYGVFWVNNKSVAAHRYAYELCTAKPELFLLHSCDTPACVNPSHLREGSHQENMNDMVEKDRAYKPIGGLNKQAKLTEEDVLAIRALYASGMAQRAIAQQYGLCQQTVSDIIRRKLWIHI
jgi:DNA-binding NarL/FixJ family response regulator